MKTGVTLLAFAASAAATFPFRNFPPFQCPENTDNKCTDKQKPGFSFDDLDFGPFTGYHDFSWNGFTCGNVGGNGRFNKRTGGKKIGGVCSGDKKSSPSFGCGPKIDKFSLGSIHVKPEFDCDLEFHYDMPDGKTCKHRSPCKKSGTTVVNKQCGGAKNVTIVFPPQPNKPKPVCSIDIHTISFDCNPPKTTFVPPVPTVPTLPPTTSPNPPATTPPTGPGTSPSAPASSPSVPSSSPPAPVPSSSASESSSTKPTTLPPFSSVSSNSPASSEITSSQVSTSEITTTVVTSFETTSTIFSTVVSTITSCAPTVTNCPKGPGGVTTTVVTVAVSTTVCPVTETHTTVLTTTTSVPVVVVPPTSNKPTTISSNSPSTTSPSKPPVNPLPCPDVVPKCLNTFLFNVKCKDNSDHKCFCPDSIFVKDVMECIFAHGETVSIVTEAIVFFQGICAPFAPGNPGIITAVPTFLPPAPTSVGPIYTTITIDTTTVVPCTDDAGEIIPSSSTTKTIFTTVPLPQIDFTTQSGTVAIIPITQPAQPVQTGPADSVPGSPGKPGAPGAGSPGFFTTKAPIGAPIGTGGIRPNPTGAIVTAGSGRLTAGLGFVVVAVFAAVGL